MKNKIKNNSSLFKTISIIFAIIVIFLTVILVCIMNKDNFNSEKENSNPIIILETTKGIIKIELNETAAPLTVANFLNYTNSKFYDGLVFHRVIKGFMIQAGGFETTGEKKDTNKAIKIESNNNLTNSIGTIAMARTIDPNSATSQFFINVANNDFLNYQSESNPGYTVFGKVIEGMEIIQTIENVETTTKTGYQNWPVEDIVIIKAYQLK